MKFVVRVNLMALKPVKIYESVNKEDEIANVNKKAT